MAVFTATGTGGKYIGSVQFQTWFNGKEDTNPYGIGNCSLGMLQPGQSIVCVGETELVSSGNGMVAGRISFGSWRSIQCSSWPKILRAI